jgi:hypothetical protein
LYQHDLTAEDAERDKREMNNSDAKVSDIIQNPGKILPLFLKPAQAGFVCIEAISIAESYRG